MERLAHYMSLLKYSHIVHISFRITNIVNFLSQTFVFLQDMLFKNDSGFELHNNLAINVQFSCNI